DKAHWLLSILGSEVLHCGPLGSGQVIKLANNIATSINLASAFEAYHFAKSKNANTEILHQLMKETAADSWQLRNSADNAMNYDYSSLGAKINILLKDMTLALTEAQKNNINIPTAEGAIHWYEKSVANGDGELDMGAIYKNK